MHLKLRYSGLARRCLTHSTFNTMQSSTTLIKRPCLLPSRKALSTSSTAIFDDFPSGRPIGRKNMCVCTLLAIQSNEHQRRAVYAFKVHSRRSSVGEKLKGTKNSGRGVLSNPRYSIAPTYAFPVREQSFVRLRRLMGFRVNDTPAHQPGSVFVL
jgi:hypothetical protein